MINTLQLQFFRIKKSVTFWILLGLCLGLPLLSALFQLLLIGLLNNGPIDWGGIVEFGDVTVAELQSFASMSNDAAVLAVICTSVLLCKEFSGGTIRNIFLSDKSRAQVYGALSVVAVLIGAVYFTAYYLFTLMFNGLILGFGSLSAAQVANACLLSFALGLVAMLLSQSFVVMFLFCLRKTAATMVLSFVLMLVAPAVIQGVVEGCLLVASINGTTVADAALGWIPLYNVSMLDLSNPDGALIGKILLYELPLAALFFFLGWVALRKADIK